MRLWSWCHSHFVEQDPVSLPHVLALKEVLHVHQMRSSLLRGCISFWALSKHLQKSSCQGVGPSAVLFPLNKGHSLIGSGPHMLRVSQLGPDRELVWLRSQGTISGQQHAYELDDGHTFVTGKPALVCGNTAAMVGEQNKSWLSKHFQVQSDLFHWPPSQWCPGQSDKFSENMFCSSNRAQVS